MRLRVTPRNRLGLRIAEVELEGDVELSKVFSGLTIVTEAGDCFGIAQRDSGIEIVAQGESDHRIVSIQKDQLGRLYVIVDNEMAWREGKA